MFFAFFSKLWSYIVSFLFETGLDEFLRSIDFEGFELVGIAFEEVDTGFGKVEVVREIAYQILIGFALYRWCFDPDLYQALSIQGQFILSGIWLNFDMQSHSVKIDFSTPVSYTHLTLPTNREV